MSLFPLGSQWLLNICRFDAVGLVTSTNVWVDGCELQDQLLGEYVVPDEIDGWQVDRFDGKLELTAHKCMTEVVPFTGLFDCEDGTDNASDDAMDHRRSLPSAGTSVGSSATATLVKVHVSVTLKATRHARLETAVKLGPSEI